MVPQLYMGADVVVDPGDGTQYGPPAPGLIQRMGLGWDMRATIGLALAVFGAWYIYTQDNE